MVVEVLNWKKYNPRTDVKNPSWFRLGHDLFENPDFYDFSHAEILAWVYILCIASKKNTENVLINDQHLERIGRIKRKDLSSALDKLKQIQCVIVHVTQPLRERDGCGTFTNATNERTNVTNETERDETHRPDETHALETSARNPIIAPHWNDFSSKAKETLSQVSPEVIRGWLETFPSAEFFVLEANKATNWIQVNPKKAPKNFVRFFNNWLNNGWETYRKSIPSSKKSAAEEWREKSDAKEGASS